MDEAIARLNIEHFQQRLAAEKDEATRQTIQRLLAEEERKLAAVLKAKAEATEKKRS